jgi:hypothetical protein
LENTADTMQQSEFFDLSERYQKLSELRDPLEAIQAW